jgi:predicted PurR-regulated permease PerM
MTSLPTPAEADASADATTDAALASAAAPVAPLLAPADDAPKVLLNAPVDVRSVSLVVIAVLASLVVLHWASAVFVPLLLGLMFSYALTPLVNRLVRLRLPRALAAALLLIGIAGGVGWITYSLSDDATSMIETLPEAAQKLRRSLEGQRSQGPAGAIDKVQKAATEIERATEGSGGASPAPSRGVAKVQIEKPKFDVKDYLWTGALNLAMGAAHAVVILFITFFLLASGDTFRRKMVKIAGPTFGQKKLTLQALDEIDLQIQRYLMVQVFTSALVGMATWLAFLWLGVEHAAVWGVVNFVLNFVPYLGSIAATGAAALTGFVQFGSFEMALLIGGAALFIHVVEGYIVTPWLTGRASRMNPVAVFVGVLAWGWLWGVAGLFLGVPILMVIKAVCDRVDDLKAVGELLGD